MYRFPNGLIRTIEKLAKEHAEKESIVKKALGMAKSSMPSEPLASFINEQEQWLKKYQKLIEKPKYIRDIERQRNALSFISQSYPGLIQVSGASGGSVVLRTKDKSQETEIENVSNLALVRTLMPDVSVTDCFDFVNHLSELPYLGYKHKVGKDIYEYISKQESVLIDKVPAFRVRKSTARKEIPYTPNEMFEPMYTSPGQSRFASVGHNPLYLCSNLDIAKRETEVETDSRYTWIELEFAREFRMLNITNANIPIYDHCHKRTITHDASLMTEYLMPNYISDCAKDLGFEGLIYNSVHRGDVSNYVLFGAGKRDFHVIGLEGVGYNEA